MKTREGGLKKGLKKHFRLILTIEPHQKSDFKKFFFNSQIIRRDEYFAKKNFNLVPKLRIFLPCACSSKFTFRYKNFLAEKYFFILSAKN